MDRHRDDEQNRRPHDEPTTGRIDLHVYVHQDDSAINARLQAIEDAIRAFTDTAGAQDTIDRLADKSRQQTDALKTVVESTTQGT